MRRSRQPSNRGSAHAKRRGNLHTPQGSPLREDLGAGVRVAPFGRYLIFYTVHEATAEVRVERILHAVRDIEQGFFHYYNKDNNIRHI